MDDYPINPFITEEEEKTQPGPEIHLCPHCKQPLTKIVKLTNYRTLTKTFTEICRNKHCWSYIDLRKVRSWIKIDNRHYTRDFTTQNRPEYNPNLSRRQYV